MKRASGDRLEELQLQSRTYESIANVRISEPRIEMIRNRLQVLLRVVQLESGGRPVEITGFRLKDPARWTSPQPPVSSELWHISNACNMRCPFCYEEGDPEGSSTLNEPTGMATMAEIEARLHHRNRLLGTGLFRPLTYMNEMFCHPRVMEIIEQLRAFAPDEVLTFVTNGSYLTPDVVRQLEQFKPVFFNFSVNSVDPVIRRKVLGDQNPEIAIQALDLLRKYRLPYLGSLVCWPTIPWADVENTARQLDAAGCAVIRFSLSAYSKHLKGQRYDRRKFWEQGLKLALALRNEIGTPIKLEPYQFMDATHLPNIVGSVRGSPAARAGLRPGDRLLTVDGESVKSSNHALAALGRARQQGSRMTVVYERGGRIATAELDNSAGPFGYPYDEVRNFPAFAWGLLLMDNLRFHYLQQIRHLITRRGAKRVLLCSSALMKPIVEQMIAASRAFADVHLTVGVPENRYFGGTIVLGDLLVVEDYVDFINEQKRCLGPIDLALIPSSPFSLGEWFRDLTGAPFTEIERRTGVPTELVHCRPLVG
jgi:uncharacterized Fe-S cluster-containing radical SAM superfamily protein